MGSKKLIQFVVDGSLLSREKSYMTSTAPILIVDDDPGLRALVAATLELEGHSVLTAPDGTAALNIVEQYAPALILLDKSMPRMDGPGFANELRSRGFAIPIVVISGSDGGKLFARDINALSFIRKPFKVPQLLSTVTDLLSKFADDTNGGSRPAAAGG